MGIYYGEYPDDVGTMGTGKTRNSQKFGQELQCDRSSVQDDLTSHNDNDSVSTTAQDDNGSVHTTGSEDSTTNENTSTNDTTSHNDSSHNTSSTVSRKRKQTSGSSRKAKRHEQCMMLNMDALKEKNRQL